MFSLREGSGARLATTRISRARQRSAIKLCSSIIGEMNVKTIKRSRVRRGVSKERFWKGDEDDDEILEQ